jgi:TPR repeat protein
MIFIVLLIRGALRGKRTFLRAIAIVFGITSVIALPFYIPGWWFMLRGLRDNGAAMYQLARWHENHCEKIGALILWPCTPNVEAGYRALEVAAAAGHTPAIYALGVRLKYGDHVPKPPGWTGPGGNVFDQPERGQPLIDQALQAGFTPTVEERLFYSQVFRK